MEIAQLVAVMPLSIGGDSHAEWRFVEHDEPLLSVRDLGATRGDGVFETIGVRRGAPQALEPHLERFSASARALDLPAPRIASWRAVILEACRRRADVTELAVKIVYTRGIEGSGMPTGWLLAVPCPDFTVERTEGIRIVTLDRGYRHDVTATSPWLLQGAKTLSYAVNTAALREATRRGADDVLFVSSDGIALEGPTSTLVYRRGDRLLTPASSLPILAGTTSAAVLDHAAELGLSTDHVVASVDEVIAADAAWLVSSIRMAAPIRSIDGVDLAVDPQLTSSFNERLLGRTT